MDIEQPEEEASERSNVLRNLRTTGVLSTSIAKLSGSSRIIPSSKDFHFYDNFQEFKQPLKATDEKSRKLLREIGELGNLFGKVIELPDDREVELDDDVALDWLVNVNDEIFERLDASLDEFRRVRKKEEESGVRMMRVDDHQLDDGFQMVHGKKNKKLVGSKINVDEEKVNGVQEVKMAIKVKPKVPFHVPTLARPQDEYKIIVNNSNQPFEHVWLQKSEDGSRFIHPLEKLDVLDFVDRSESICEPVKPPSIEVTPFKLVEEVRDLKQLANKLRAVDEFAVDLEHNQYRSFQGLTCLMQISTRTEDFVIDTLKLRIQIGPHLREVFKDPTKRKVMHGSDNDILWLQKDFGIYVCNMFDTGQASRVMKLERYSLEYLLNYFCGVAANKEYQNADWRIRPLPREMVKYAREDTHYLLYIYDVMRIRLLALPVESDSVGPPLIQVYKRSYDICTQLYEKELLTDDSYLYIYGLHGADLSAQQLAVVSALCEWRDVVARAEDESTGYVLPNRTLIDLAKQMPLTASKLHHALKSKHPYIERNLGSVVSIIRHAIQNAAAFEETAEYLKKRRLEMLTHANKEEALAAEESEVLPSDVPEILEDAEMEGNISNLTAPDDLLASISLVSEQQNNPLQDIDHAHINMSSSNSVRATVQVLKKPTRAFGALLGRRKFDLVKRVQEDPKLEHIKSTVSLPFHTFAGTDEQLRSDTEESANLSEASPRAEIPAPITISAPLDIIHLNQDSDNEESAAATPMEQDENNETGSDEGNEDQSRSALQVVKPFDYEAARKEVHFGKAAVTKSKENDGDNSTSRKKKNVADKNDLLPQGRRRQAFPASGNRSATFR